MSDTALNKIIQYGTNANRLLFTPNPATSSKVLYFWYTTDTTTLYLWNGSAWVAVSAGSSQTFPARAEGRLTVVTGTPVPTTDQTGKSTLYWTPCDPALQSITHGVISLYNGSSIVDISITEISLALTGLTSGKNYDVFIDYNSGTPQLVLSAACTNDGTRADALGSQYDSSRLETIIIKSGTAAYRWVGTIRTTGTTTTEDSLANRNVFNAYNQTLRVAYKSVATDETTNSTSYTDLSTAGPTIGFFSFNGEESVSFYDLTQCSGAGQSGFTSINISGATTTAAADVNGFQVTNINSGVGFSVGRTNSFAITAGYNIFKMQYRVDGNTFHFFNRTITTKLMY